VTIFPSSHQLSEVEATCDQVGVLNAGRVVAKGSLESLLTVSDLRRMTLERTVETNSANVFPLRAIAAVFNYVLPNLERFNLNETVAHSEQVFKVGARTLFFLLGLTAIFGIAFLAAGIGLFRKRDF